MKWFYDIKLLWLLWFKKLLTKKLTRTSKELDKFLPLPQLPTPEPVLNKRQLLPVMIEMAVEKRGTIIDVIRLDVDNPISAATRKSALEYLKNGEYTGRSLEPTYPEMTFSQQNGRINPPDPDHRGRQSKAAAQQVELNHHHYRQYHPTEFKPQYPTKTPIVGLTVVWSHEFHGLVPK